MAQSNESPRETLWRLVKDIRFAMLTTRHAGGHLHSRPMTTQNSKIDESDSLWFFMSRASEALSDLEHDEQVNVVYAHPGKDRYISVSGEAAVVEDMTKKSELWNKMAEAWFPSGVGDPQLALVQVRISHAHYWDVEASKIVQIYAMAKAAMTGRPPVGLGHDAEVPIRGTH